MAFLRNWVRGQSQIYYLHLYYLLCCDAPLKNLYCMSSCMSSPQAHFSPCFFISLHLFISTQSNKRQNAPQKAKCNRASLKSNQSLRLPSTDSEARADPSIRFSGSSSSTSSVKASPVYREKTKVLACDQNVFLHFSLKQYILTVFKNLYVACTAQTFCIFPFTLDSLYSTTIRRTVPILTVSLHCLRPYCLAK